MKYFQVLIIASLALLTWADSIVRDYLPPAVVNVSPPVAEIRTYYHYPTHGQNHYYGFNQQPQKPGYYPSYHQSPQYHGQLQLWNHRPVSGQYFKPGSGAFLNQGFGGGSLNTGLGGGSLNTGLGGGSFNQGLEGGSLTTGLGGGSFNTGLGGGSLSTGLGGGSFNQGLGGGSSNQGLGGGSLNLGFGEGQISYGKPGYGPKTVIATDHGYVYGKKK